MSPQDLLEHDRTWTLANRARLLTNKNLLLWYENLYRHQFNNIENINNKLILEVGSGTSPLTLFYKNVLTSDVLDLDYLDYTLDCHDIDKCGSIKDESLDIITMTNVLHHLKDPVAFLIKAASKLKSGGTVILTEPYFSVLSKIIYQCLHHERSDFSVEKPKLESVQGPLSSANMAIPYMLFFSEKKWKNILYDHYAFSKESITFFSSLSYMATGGISRKIPIPTFLYRIFLALDLSLATKLPRLLCSFFIIKLVKK